MDSNIPRDELLDGDTLVLEVDIGESTQVANKMIIAKTYTPKPVNKPAMRSIVYKICRAPNDIQMQDLGDNNFTFSFANEDTPRRILTSSPWFVMGHLLMVRPWMP